ncbi:hypothetical protein [Gordonia aichiensis]
MGGEEGGDLAGAGGVVRVVVQGVQDDAELGEVAEVGDDAVGEVFAALPQPGADPRRSRS